MNLYHGSTVTVLRPSIRFGRANTDFGKGVYTTTEFEQAARWARIRRRRAGSGSAIVSVYEMEDSVLEDSRMHMLKYHGATVEWLNFVVRNRRTSPMHDFDMVFGPVANDNLYATISMYENGQLSVEAAIVQLKTHVLFNQISFHTTQALSQIRFVESFVVE